MLPIQTAARGLSELVSAMAGLQMSMLTAAYCRFKGSDDYLRQKVRIPILIISLVLSLNVLSISSMSTFPVLCPA